MMKKIFMLGIIILFLLSGCAEQEETIKVGVIFQETGPASDYGERANRGVELALEKINHQGGIHGRLVELVYEDSRSNPKDAVTGMNKLITLNNVKLIISQQSSVVVALSPIANQNEVILMDIGATTPVYISPDDFTFRVAYSASYFAKEIASFLNKKGVKTMSILYINNDYGLGMLNTYKEYFEGRIVAEEKFSQEETDFRTQLQKIKEKNPEVLVYVAHASQAGILLKQKKELDLTQPVYTDAYTIEYASVLEVAGDVAEGIIYVSQDYDFNREDSVFKEFNDRFIEIYGENSNPLSAQAYDGLMVLAFVMNQCVNPENTDCIKNKLFELEDFPGVIGPISFDRYGEVIERPTILKTVKNGEFVRFKEE